ncbi:MAG: hypothetical protein JSS98_09975 [Bacteroidetes bacterium]|nr:hypothetical protein [Bacteroidota bacterium]
MAAYGLRAITQVSSLRATRKALCRVKTLVAKQSHQAVPEIASCLAMTIPLKDCFVPRNDENMVAMTVQPKGGNLPIKNFRSITSGSRQIHV